MKLLKEIDMSEEMFDRLLTVFSLQVKAVDNLQPFLYGYKPKRTIYYSKDANNDEWLICEEFLVRYIDPKYSESTEWKQVRVKKNKDIKGTTSNISGIYAYNYVNKLFKNYYTEEEIEKRLNMFEADYDPSLKQYHLDYFNEYNNTIYKLTNCYYYDINGAHADALCEIFPKAKDAIIKLRKLKDKDPKYKNYFNFYVGFLCRKNHKKTYNWIVQRTTKQIFDAMNKVGGTIIYSNTDSLVVKDPTDLIITSKNLGDFKLEHQGDVYFCRHLTKNCSYTIYQFGDTLKGTCRLSVRDKIDLKKNKLIDYNVVRNYTGIKNEKGNEIFTMKLVNIKEIIYEENNKKIL